MTAAILAGAYLMAPSVPAAAAPFIPQSAADPATVATRVSTELGLRSAGSYLDQATGRLIVTISNPADAGIVTTAGGVPRLVARSGLQLETARSGLDANLKVPGTAWAVDPVTNQVVLRTDDSVTGAALDQVRQAAQKYGDAVRVEHLPGTITTMVRGGDHMYAGNFACGRLFNVGCCSVGFNVENSFGIRSFLTAGHCATLAQRWFSDYEETKQIGFRSATSFPGNDYALITYVGNGVDSTLGEVTIRSTDPAVSPTRDITGSGSFCTGCPPATPGHVIFSPVEFNGGWSGYGAGYVRALNVTVNYREGTVTQLIETNLCATQGDSGSPVFSQNTALGLVSGGTANCDLLGGGTMYAQPVDEALRDYAVHIF